jgi:hypothetical protein
VEAITDGRNFSKKFLPFQLRITTATDGNWLNDFIYSRQDTNIKDFSFQIA